MTFSAGISRQHYLLISRAALAEDLNGKRGAGYSKMEVAGNVSKRSELARTAKVLRGTGRPLQPGLSVAFFRHSTYSKGVIHRIVTTRQAAMLRPEKEGRHRA